jgi:hypothetical protein
VAEVGVCKRSRLRFSVRDWPGAAETGLRFAMLANVDAAAGMAHVWRFSARAGGGRGVPGGGSGCPRPMGSVCDFDIEECNSGRVGVSGTGSLSAL